jgi:hypothetical protein
MSKRVNRVLERIRDYVEDERKRMGSYTVLRPKDAAEKLGIKEKVIVSAFSRLQKEGVLLNRRGHFGSYSLNVPPPYFPPMPPQRPVLPRKQKVSWGSKRRLLAMIRQKKPWVVERWYDVDQRWFMYMEHGCERDPSHFNVNGCTDMKPVAAEDQPDLPRNVIERWHFDFDAAVEACGVVKRRRPKDVFRTRDTRLGDYLMGAIL